VANYIPDRAHLIWLTFDPQAGREQAGKRPALVISPMSYNAKVGLGIFCPITSHQKGYPFEVELPVTMSIIGVILTDQIKSLDWRARNANYIETLDENTMQLVIQKLSVLIF
jgi:mRNA interferase MazF